MATEVPERIRPLTTEPGMIVTAVAARAIPWKDAPIAPDPTVKVSATAQKTSWGRTPPTSIIPVRAFWAYVPLIVSEITICGPGTHEIWKMKVSPQAPLSTTSVDTVTPVVYL